MFAKTGFWTNGERILWARYSHSEKRCEMWELTPDCESWIWTNRRDLFHTYGFVGTLAVLKYQGWSVQQRPNGYTKHLEQLPNIPYPDGWLEGNPTTYDGWTYTPAESDNEVGHVYPAKWTIPLKDYHGDVSDAGRSP